MAGAQAGTGGLDAERSGRRWDTRAQSADQLNQLDLQIDRGRQLRLRGAKRAELRQVARFGALGCAGRVSHRIASLYPGTTPAGISQNVGTTRAGVRTGLWAMMVRRTAIRKERREPMASENVKVFTDGNFSADVLQSPRPVLVDFWAEWCGPCKRIAPTVDQLASDFNGRVDIGKLNVDDNPRTPAQYSVRGIPTLLIFKGGQVVDSVVGAQFTRDQLSSLIEKHL
jgi:thioredoxin 1